jgi:hypothetical protein
MKNRKHSILKKGKNKIIISYEIKNPKLWWCNGLGEANFNILLLFRLIQQKSSIWIQKIVEILA